MCEWSCDVVLPYPSAYADGEIVWSGHISQSVIFVSATAVPPFARVSTDHISPRRLQSGPAFTPPYSWSNTLLLSTDATLPLSPSSSPYVAYHHDTPRTPSSPHPPGRDEYRAAPPRRCPRDDLVPCLGKDRSRDCPGAVQHVGGTGGNGQAEFALVLPQSGTLVSCTLH
jgi:hypothetical protein